MVKAIALLIITTLVGCSRSDAVSTPTAPSSASSALQIAAPTKTPLQLRGFVTDTAFRPVAGARVEVVDGVSAGTAVIADANGEFVLRGMFHAATRFRASSEGHETRTQPWNCSVAVCLGATNAQPWLGFYLSVLEPTVNIAGDYTLSFSADTICSALPEVARSRSYRVAVRPQLAAGRADIPGFSVKVISGQFIGTLDGFPIGAAANRLSFGLGGGHDPPVVEDLGANTYLAFSGTANATVPSEGTSTITTAFEGWIEHLVLFAPLGLWYSSQGPAISKATCESSNHRVTLTRVD